MYLYVFAGYAFAVFTSYAQIRAFGIVKVDNVGPIKPSSTCLLRVCCLRSLYEGSKVSNVTDIPKEKRTFT